MGNKLEGLSNWLRLDTNQNHGSKKKQGDHEFEFRGFFFEPSNNFSLEILCWE